MIANRGLLALLFFVLLGPSAWAGYPAETFRTGQTKCYNTVGLILPCSGTGQDGEKKTGITWPWPRFIDNFDGTVTDRLTGLEWMKNAGAAKPWAEAFDYVKSLTTGGHSDWRLPNAVELQSLIDDSRAYPALPKPNPFVNVWTTGCDLSLTSCDYATGDAWAMHMGNGVVFYQGRTDTVFIWPVRSASCGTPVPSSGSATAAQITAGPGSSAAAGLGSDTTRDGAVNWQLALAYIKKLNDEASLGGHSDWRLPNKNELRSLTDYSRSAPALPPDHPFKNIQPGMYWSSTTRKIYPYQVMTVNHLYGNVTCNYKWESLYVWPVRGGEAAGGSSVCLPKTGQAKCYDSDGALVSCAGTGQDGELQQGAAWPEPRFTNLGDGTVRDNLTGLIWAEDANYMLTNNEDFDTDSICSCIGPPVQCWLRIIRDLVASGSLTAESLGKNAIDRGVLRLCCNNADGIISALDRSPALQKAAQKLLEAFFSHLDA